MTIAPGASQRGKLDRTRCYFKRQDEFPLVSGAAPFTEEGQLAVAINNGGEIHAGLATGVAATVEVPLGPILNGTIMATTFTHWETGVVPAALTYTLKFGNLCVHHRWTPLVEAYCYVVATGLEIPVTAAAAAAGDCMVNQATGLVTFNALQSGGAPTMVGVRFAIRYRWTLTTAERLALVKSSPVGRSSEDLYGKMVVGRGHGCRCFTTQYDADAIWTLGFQDGGTNSPCLGLSGEWSTITNTTGGGHGGPGTAFGRVISLPSANDPYVGFEYNTP
jgi:hypothetical protein